MLWIKKFRIMDQFSTEYTKTWPQIYSKFATLPDQYTKTWL